MKITPVKITKHVKIKKREKRNQSCLWKLESLKLHRFCNLKLTTVKIRGLKQVVKIEIKAVTIEAGPESEQL